MKNPEKGRARPPPLELNSDFYETIVRLHGRESTSKSELRRMKIVLSMLRKPAHFSGLADQLGHDRKTVSCWYHRTLAANALWPEMVENALNEPGHAGTSLRKERLVREIFADRHGTLSLIPSFEVATGKIVRHHIGETRNEQDFAEHIASTIGNRRKDQWIFISDQLNTHMSETLVRMVAELTGHEGDLGDKMEMFISYFNRTMAKPYRWTYKGLPLTA